MQRHPISELHPPQHALSTLHAATVVLSRPTRLPPSKPAHSGTAAQRRRAQHFAAKTSKRKPRLPTHAQMLPSRASPTRAAAASPGAPASPAQPVLYKSSALAATAPGLAFRRRSSVRIAAAAAAADACREAFKAAQLAKAGCTADEKDDDSLPLERRNANKYLRRLLLNRHSASASRLRKEAYTAGLERELAELEAGYNDLKRRLEQGGAAAEKDEGQGRVNGKRVVEGGDESPGLAEEGEVVGQMGDDADAGCNFDASAFELSLGPELDLCPFLD